MLAVFTGKGNQQFIIWVDSEQAFVVMIVIDLMISKKWTTAKLDTDP